MSVAICLNHSNWNWSNKVTWLKFDYIFHGAWWQRLKLIGWLMQCPQEQGWIMKKSPHPHHPIKTCTVSLGLLFILLLCAGALTVCDHFVSLISVQLSNLTRGLRLTLFSDPSTPLTLTALLLCGFLVKTLLRWVRFPFISVNLFLENTISWWTSVVTMAAAYQLLDWSVLVAFVYLSLCTTALSV